MGKCFDCRGSKSDDGFLLCRRCRDSGVRLTFPGVHGLSDGPGHGTIRSKDDIIFDRPDVAKEMEFTFKKMEEKGKFRGKPDLLKKTQACLKQAKDKPQEKVDYGKGDTIND